MAESYAFSLLGVMDRLWFHQTIFFTESPSVSCPQHLESLKYSTIENSQTSLIPEDVSSVAFEITSPLVDREDEVVMQNEITQKERPTRSDLVASKNRSHSSSPSVDKRQKRLQRTKSCKSLGELELEEVKGFMDLGFIFDKEQASKKMMSILPGLQRLELIKTKPKGVLSRNSQRKDNYTGLEDDDKERGIVRPYLSEAWLVRPNSSLLNLRMPRDSAAADMKNHLRHWAKTVATVVRQES